MLQTFYFVVRSVLVSRNSSAVTLEPVEWTRDSTTGATIEIDGETFPDSEPCEPADPGAEPFPEGGKMTELRFNEETDLRPDEYVTITVARSRP